MLLGWDGERQAFARAVRANGVPLRVIAVSEAPVVDPPAWLLVVEPGKVRQGLELCRTWV